MQLTEFIQEVRSQLKTIGHDHDSYIDNTCPKYYNKDFKIIKDLDLKFEQMVKEY